MDSPKYGRYGRGCPYQHPRMCQNYLRRGDTGCDRNCGLFHPKLCTKSLKYGECLRKKCFFYHVTGTARPHVNQIGRNSLQSAKNTHIPYQHPQAQRDLRYRTCRTDNVYQQHAGMNSPHNEHTRVHESSHQNNNISDSNHYEQSYVRDSPRYGNNNNYFTINQEYQHSQQQQATQNIHHESSSHFSDQRVQALTAQMIAFQEQQVNSLSNNAVNTAVISQSCSSDSKPAPTNTTSISQCSPISGLSSKTKCSIDRQEESYFSFMILNVAHLLKCSTQDRSKIEFLSDIVQKHCLFIGLTETHLSETIFDNELKIDSYNIVSSDRLNRSGGGICLYINSSVQCKTCVAYSNSVCELLIVKIHSPDIYIVLIYRPPAVKVMNSQI